MGRRSWADRCWRDYIRMIKDQYGYFLKYRRTTVLSIGEPYKCLETHQIQHVSPLSIM